MSWFVPCAMSFVAAWIDTVCFVALYGLFTAHVTGNFVVIGTAIAGTGLDQGSLFAKVVALPVFAIGAAAATLVVRGRERRGRPAARLVVLLEASLLCGLLLCGLAATPIIDAGEPWPLAAGGFALLAMGLQNAAGRLVFPAAAPTAVMTLNVTQALIDLVDAMCRTHARDETTDHVRRRLRRLAPPIAAFTIGALAAAWVWRIVGFACVAVPIVVLVAVALHVGRRA